jgi:hypothetical protein
MRDGGVVRSGSARDVPTPQRVERHPLDAFERRGVTWNHESLGPDGRTIVLRWGCTPDDLVAEWPGFAVLVAARSEGHAHRLYVAPRASEEVVEKLHRGAVRALIHQLGGGESLHASAVAFRGLAVACAGESGAGKSTMAAELCARSGAELLADDCVRIDWRRDLADVADLVEVLPNGDAHWLPDDARLGLPSVLSEGEAKAKCTPSRVASASARLVAIVWLSFSTDKDVRLARLSGAEAFARLSASAVNFVQPEGLVMVDAFDRLVALKRSVPFFELRRPRDLTTLADGADLIAKSFLVRESPR